MGAEGDTHIAALGIIAAVAAATTFKAQNSNGEDVRSCG